MIWGQGKRRKKVNCLQKVLKLGRALTMDHKGLVQIPWQAKKKKIRAPEEARSFQHLTQRKPNAASKRKFALWASNR